LETGNGIYEISKRCQLKISFWAFFMLKYFLMKRGSQNFFRLANVSENFLMINSENSLPPRKLGNFPDPRTHCYEDLIIEE